MINKDLKARTIAESTSDYSFYVYFALQFSFVAMGMLFNVKVGVFSLLLTLIMIPIVLGRCSSLGYDMRRSKNGMLYIYIILGFFYLAEISNSNHVQEAWNIAIAHYWLYPFAMALVVPVVIRSEKAIEILLIIWSVFILIATLKGYWQKSYGFNEKEKFFLYVLGGAKTHIIWSGIRYFSFFSDAANFGVHAAIAATTFAISSFYIRKFWLKVYILFVAICALYCIGISGTRVAVAIPMVGLLVFCILSKNWKTMLCCFAIVGTSFVFFYFTNIGSSNPYIFKMRSAFRPKEDASYIVRIENKKRMRILMQDHPLGYGLGLSKGERFNPKYIMPYPPDSWLVSVWVETGQIGLILYITAHVLLFAWCSWILLCKVQNGRIRGLIGAWLCMAIGFFVAAYANDVMQYPNTIPIYTGLALCFAAPHIDKISNATLVENDNKEEKKEKYKLYNPLI